MNVSSIDHGNAFDFGRTSALYAKYRDIYPPELYDRLRALGVGRAGSCWVDVGTGTGVLPLHLYTPGAAVIGADISETQIAAAKDAAAEKGFDIRFIVSPAETLPLPDHSADVVTAAQCFWYFDREKIIDELRRVLKPDGTFVKIYLSWCSTDPIARRSCALIKRLNPAWTPGASGVRDIYDHPFPGGKVESFVCDLPFTRESWHGRMLACRGTTASMDEKTLAEWDNRHRRMLAKCPEQFTVRHRVYIASYTVFS